MDKVDWCLNSILHRAFGVFLFCIISYQVSIIGMRLNLCDAQLR